MVALLWNVALDHLIPDDVWQHSPKPPANGFDTGAWRDAFAGAPFGPFAQASFEHEQTLTRDSLVDYFASISWIAVVPDAERTAKVVHRARRT